MTNATMSRETATTTLRLCGALEETTTQLQIAADAILKIRSMVIAEVMRDRASARADFATEVYAVIEEAARKSTAPKDPADRASVEDVHGEGGARAA